MANPSPICAGADPPDSVTVVDHTLIYRHILDAVGLIAGATGTDAQIGIGAGIICVGSYELCNMIIHKDGGTAIHNDGYIETVIVVIHARKIHLAYIGNRIAVGDAGNGLC
jgi:hypothetical protein